MPTNSTACCGHDTCIRKELAALLEPDSSILDRICVTANVVAQTCSSLGTTDLQSCASKLFNVFPECELTSEFVRAYRTERDRIAARRRIERIVRTSLIFPAPEPMPAFRVCSELVNAGGPHAAR
jgi:hypothetical protein